MENFDNPHTESTNEIAGTSPTTSLVAGSAYGLEAIENNTSASSALLPLTSALTGTSPFEVSSKISFNSETTYNGNNISSANLFATTIQKEAGETATNGLGYRLRINRKYISKHSSRQLCCLYKYHQDLHKRRRRK